MNVHDSERMLGILRGEGFVSVDEPEEADLVVFNTCSIRQKAEQKFYSQLGRTKKLKRNNPSMKIAVAGCIAQQEGKALMGRMPYVDLVIGPQNLKRLGGALTVDGGVYTGENPDIAIEEIPACRGKGVRAWVNIMYGCNNFCSYCVVPYTRGRERSRPAGNIISEIKELAGQGYREVTLLGQNVNSYKGDLGFPVLLERINGIDGLKRIRFVTSHPKDLSTDLVHAVRDLEKVCEHIHLPLQSGSDRILALMNRRYTFREYLEKIELLREAVPDIAITTDLIAGFPTETEDDHLATINAMREIRFDGIFAFKYSPRPRTRASGMEGRLPDGLKGERLMEILSLQDEITELKNRELVGKGVEVLVEGPSEAIAGYLTGRTRTNKIVNFPGEEGVVSGSIVDTTIRTAHRHSLEGTLTVCDAESGIQSGTSV